MIPKVVHRIWFGPEPMRTELVDWGHAWERFGYQVHLWTESNLPDLRNQHEYDQTAIRGVQTGCAPRRLGVWTQRADIVSYELVWRFGGIYANCDIEPLRDVHDLLDGIDAFCGWEVEETIVCNAIFGAAAAHPWMNTTIERLPHRFRNLAMYQTMQMQTGPHLLTEATGDHPEVTVFPKHTFYPYGFEEMDREHDAHPDSFTAHHWGHTRG